MGHIIILRGSPKRLAPQDDDRRLDLSHPPLQHAVVGRADIP
jgi:hypothetical protein